MKISVLIKAQIANTNVTTAANGNSNADVARAAFLNSPVVLRAKNCAP